MVTMCPWEPLFAYFMPRTVFREYAEPGRVIWLRNLECSMLRESHFFILIFSILILLDNIQNVGCLVDIKRRIKWLTVSALWLRLFSRVFHVIESVEILFIIKVFSILKYFLDRWDVKACILSPIWALFGLDIRRYKVSRDGKTLLSNSCFQWGSKCIDTSRRLAYACVSMT